MTTTVTTGLPPPSATPRGGKITATCRYINPVARSVYPATGFAFRGFLTIRVESWDTVVR
jgi:hypothetical protein